MSSLIEDSGYCPYCEKQVVIHRKATSHLFHLFMTLITGGLWLFVWIICGIDNVYFGDWRCAHCGLKVKKGSMARDYQKIARNGEEKVK